MLKITTKYEYTTEKGLRFFFEADAVTVNSMEDSIFLGVLLTALENCEDYESGYDTIREELSMYKHDQVIKHYFWDCDNNDEYFACFEIQIKQ